MKRIYLFFFFAMTFSGWCISDTIKNEDEIKAFASSVLEDAVSGNISRSFESMAKYVILPIEQLNDAEKKTEYQRRVVGQLIGRSYGYEFVSEERLGKSLIKLKYLEKAKGGGIFWQFYFYKGQDGWLLASFKWDDKIQSFFND